MTSSPLISVIMPVYNAEKYIGEAVESILNQTFRDFEFLIIDDGSTDDSMEILRRYEKQDSRIRLISRPNTGYVIALNEMLALAKGEFIARMDADDISLPERFATQVSFLSEHPQVVLLGTSSDRIDAKGRLIGRRIHHLSSAEIALRLLEGDNPLLHPSVMFRRDAVVAAGGYDPSMMPAEDLDLWLRLSERGDLAVLPDILVRYRLHSSSVSESQQDKQMEKKRIACETAWLRRGEKRSVVVGPWRPRDAASEFSFTAIYGWGAWSLGQRRTTIQYAGRLIRMRPFSAPGWRMLAVALLKTPPCAAPAQKR